MVTTGMDTVSNKTMRMEMETSPSPCNVDCNVDFRHGSTSGFSTRVKSFIPTHSCLPTDRDAGVKYLLSHPIVH